MLVMVFGIVVETAQAVSPPNIITYQGRVLDANSAPVSSSSVSMTFLLYSALTGGSCLWSNSSATCATTTARTVTLTNGLFTENLGDTAASTPYAAIADTVFADDASVYLEVIIAGETLTPRKQLVAAPYALNAGTLDGIDLSVIQLWEVGTNGSYEDDAAAIVGVNAAFSYGSGGVGDLRVADQLEVMDDLFVDNDLIIGASVSSTETITNASFSLSGNDLFAASDVGIEGNLYLDGDVAVDGDDITSDGDITITGATGLNLVATTGTLDLSTSAATNITATLGGATNLFNILTGNLKIGTGTPTNTQDGEDLYVTGRFEADGDVRIDNAFAVNNATTSDSYINMSSTGDFVIQDNGTGYFTFNNDRSIDYSSNQTTTDPFDFTVDSVTSGNGMDFSVDGLTTGRGLYVTSTSGSLSSADLSALATSGTYTSTATVTGNVMDLSRSLIISDGNAGVISNLNVTSPVATFSDNCASAGNDVCTTSGNVLLLTQSFTSSGDVLGISNAGTGDAINIAGAGTGTAIDVDATTYSIDLEFQNGLTIDNDDDNDLNFIENSLTLNLDFGEATANEIGYSSANDLNFISTSTNSDSLVLFANGSGGGVTIIGGSAATDAGENGNDVALEAGDDVLIDSGDDVGFGMADDATFTLAASGNVVIDAATTDHTSTTGALDINFDSSVDFASGINLAVTAIDDDAADSIIGLFIDQTIQNDTTATDTVYGTMINITNADTSAAGTGLYIDVDDDGVGIVNSGITISNSQATDIDLTDALLVQATTSDSIADAIDVSDNEITNAINAGQNFIVMDATRMFSSAGAIIWEDTSGNDLMTLTDSSNVGDLVLTGDLQVNGDDIISDSSLTINPSTYTRIGDGSTPGNASTDDDFYVSGNFEIDGTSYFDGIVDVDLGDAWTTTTSGILEMDIIAGDAAVYAEHIALTQGNGATAGREATAFGILLDAEDGDGNLIGINVINQAGTSAGVAGNYEALLRLTNTEAAAAIVTDAILIQDTSSTSGTIVDAIDVSDTEIDNALNVGANTIVGTTGVITYSGATTWSSTGGDVSISANAEGSDLLLGGGDTLQNTITGGNDVEIRAEDDFFINVTDDTSVRLQAGGNFEIDAATNDHTTTSGAFSISFDSTGAAVPGTIGMYIDAELIDDSDSADYFKAMGIRVTHTGNDADNVYGLEISQANTSADVVPTTALVYIKNVETANRDDDVTAGILFDDSGTAGFIYAIDTEGATIDTADIKLENGETIDNNTDGIVDIEGKLQITLDGLAVTDEALCAGTAAAGEGGDGDQGDQTNILISDCAAAPTSDYAEQYPVATGISYGDIVVPGTQSVTTIDGQTIVQLVKSSTAYQGPVSGIVSDNYGDFTSAGYNINAADNPMPVALVGRVPVNVTNENGAIRVGDYLTTSSTPGHAMKATEIGRVIGMALADFSGTTGQIMVQVNNGWYMGDIIASDGSSTIVTDKAVMAPLGVASASTPSVGSYGFALRGSAWNGAQAQAVEMMLKTSVTDTNHFRLSVHNTTDTEVAYITNTGTMQIAGDMVITGKLYPSDRGVVQTSKYIYYDGSSGAGGDFMRTNAAGWSTGSYDFAEMFPSDESLQSGEIVVFADRNQKVRRSMEADSPRIAGIVSTRPGFLAGENTIGSHPIALAGRVPTRVTSENGEVRVGDPLTTSSKPGYAMKATDPGMIVGYALEPLVSGDGNILVYVNVGYWGGEATSSAPGTNNQASGFATGTNVNYSALNMTGNIYVSGNEILSVGRIAGISDVWSIEQDGTMKTEALLKTVIRSYTDEKVETIAITSPEAIITLTGTAKTSDGQAEVRFEDVAPEFNDVTAADAPLRVVVTPSGPVSLYVSEKDQNHFSVKQFAGETMDVEFDWMVTAYRKGYEPKPASVILSDQLPFVILSEPQASEGSPESASPESPDSNLVDSLTEDEGGDQAEQPSESLIETMPEDSETNSSKEVSSVQEAVTE